MAPLDVSLADLIARLDWELAEATDLERIGEAHLRARTLSDLGEQLVSHYVDKAKQSGASWTQIGDAIGVSKQAAQQRHTPNPFEGFTESNRHSVVLAQEAARAHKHDVIGTEHLLLGLLGEPRGLAYQVLTAPPASEQHVRAHIEKALAPPGTKALRGHIAFAPDSKQALEQAPRSAADLGHDWVGTEHTLLGLVHAPDSPAGRILRDLGFTPEGLQQTIATAAPAHRRPHHGGGEAPTG